MAEPSKKELLARFGDKMAKPFKDKPNDKKKQKEDIDALIDKVIEGSLASHLLAALIEKQEPYKVSSEPYKRALDRIKNLEQRGVDLEQHTMLRLSKATNPGKIQGIYYAADDYGLNKVKSAAAKKFFEIVGVKITKYPDPRNL